MIFCGQSIQLVRKQAEDGGEPDTQSDSGLRKTSGFKFVTQFDLCGAVR